MGDDENHRKVCIVAWAKLCFPKISGGLGLRQSRKVNSAFMMRTSWTLYDRKDVFWVRIIREKNKCGDDPILKINVQKLGSNLW